MGYSLFRRRFQEMFGIPPYRFVLNERIKKVCWLMADGAKPYAASVAIGMRDPYHFSRIFKKVMGLPPRDYCRFLRKG